MFMNIVYNGPFHFSKNSTRSLLAAASFLVALSAYLDSLLNVDPTLKGFMSILCDLEAEMFNPSCAYAFLIRSTIKLASPVNVDKSDDAIR